MSSLSVFEAAIHVKSTRDKVVFENQKKRKYGNKINLYINLHPKDRLDIDSQSS